MANLGAKLSFFESKHGLAVLAMAFVANFVSIGIGFYGFGVFFKPLEEHFNWSRALVSWGPAISLAVSALYAPRVGKAVDRYGMRPLLIVGAVGATCALTGLGFMNNMYQYLLLFGVLFSLGNIHMADIVTSTTVARFFTRKRGAAIGIATMGISLGGVVIPPVAQAIINRFGWRAGFVAMAAVVTCLVLIPAVFFLRNYNRPSEEAGDVQSPEPQVSFTRAEALKSSRFYKIVAIFGLAFLPLGTMLVHQAPFITDMGITPTRAALVLSLTATMGMAGKLAWGFVFDYLEGRWVLSASLAIQGFAIYWLLQANTYADTLIFGFLFGLGMGGLVPLHTAVRVRQFGPENLGAIMGITTPVTMISQAIGNPFAGWVFDTTGAYRAAFYIFICGYLVAILTAITLRDPKYLKNRPEG